MRRGDRARRTAGVAFGGLAAVALLVPIVAVAQPQPPVTCIPGTTVCMDGQGHVRVGGQVGPGGASGTATASGRATGTAPPPQPPPTATPPAQPSPPPPAPTPTPTPAPPPATPPPWPPNAPSPYAPSYGGGGRSDTAIGMTLCPAMRVGFASGFRFGGGLCMAFFGAEWGFGFDVLAVAGGTGPGITEGSIHLSAMYRFRPVPRSLDGFFLRAGPEFRTGWVHGSNGEENWHVGVEVGAGYDMDLGTLLWRVLEVRPYAAIRVDGQPTPDDSNGHKYDLGLLLLSGIGFD